jgi:hypothetical protein
VRGGALRRAVGASAVLVAAALLLGNGVVGSTFAIFNGETSNLNSTFAGGWVGAPTAATATASGYDTSLAWTPGTHGPVTGEKLYGVDNGTNSNCTGAAYNPTALATMAAASTASYTDANRAITAPTVNGNYYCYELMSTSATAWTAPLALAGVQVGLAATNLSLANGTGTANKLEKGDKITLTFNQRTTITTANMKVCAYSTGVILLGDTANGGGCGTAADGYNVGKLTLTGSSIGSIPFSSSTVAVATTAPFTVTITLAGSNSTSTMTGTPLWKFTGSASTLSNATTHQAALCTSTATTCQPSTSTNF